MANALVLAQVPLTLLLMWLFTSWTTSAFPTLSNKKIALVIAHPDDEAMFFSPTLLALTRPDLKNHVVIICFSTGDADGLGSTRLLELKKSALMLGLRSEDDVVVIDDPSKFADGMNQDWDINEVNSVLGSYFAPNMGKSKASEAPTALVDAVITFDGQGVSGHPNHRALYHGARAFMRDLMKRHPGWKCPVALYTLTSLNVARKYSSLFDSVASIGSIVFQTKERSQFPSPMLFSQMKWFRWGWIGISRYMSINDLKKVRNP
ncbi:LmbE-like protein [Polychaeton citri CBS 116435]|uniref:N-acetylglucosaminylphosphatidylinositol deacetylase n=1 Tax=Polychaeton citri CBS 116435 TaxID=1314669 RepID=A0A9P4Q5T9_9PEZI|nr:LmbE-like protein [Polychaeton citri CBS 116435]